MDAPPRGRRNKTATACSALIRPLQGRTRVEGYVRRRTIEARQPSSRRLGRRSLITPNLGFKNGSSGRRSRSAIIDH